MNNAENRYRAHVGLPPSTASEIITPAQIEAALAAYSKAYVYPFDMRTTLAAVLTAAAEVGDAPGTAGRRGGTAAEVGEKPDIKHIARTAAVITKAKQDIIERCAQVAETVTNCDYYSMGTIAAAIRALKDKP